ncbi:hypothetical protein [Alteromonas sp. a30]|uniref:hypothetical protein n=1 Tax=Alteromonas sp. a30 TaxID=2730917 RepID=UPI002281F9C1|nr:hypothetical protein [Alteromonas sp. a30]MCY7294349.1 hypothetical protein [Alteromonas sp. a30]
MSLESYRNRRVLVSSYQPYVVKTAQKFAQQLNWAPTVWFVADENRELVKNTFPDAFQYDFFDVVKGILPQGMAYNDLLPPTPDDLDFLSKYEFNFIYMLERNDSNDSAFEYKERLAFFYHVISLWKKVIQQYQIDLVWFEEEPHQAVDYGLYLTAKLLGVTTIMTTRTISELGILPYHDFEEGFPELNTRYAKVVEDYTTSGKQIEILPSINEYVDKLNQDYQTVLKEHLWDQVEEYNQLASNRKRVFPSPSALIKKVKTAIDVGGRFIKNVPMRSDQYKAGSTMMTSQHTYREYVFNKMRAIKKKDAIKAVYNNLALDDLSRLPENKKFIYVALQYQPEKSTCPLAGRFVDQRYMIKWLASMLGDSWHILVKEHPSQFISSYTRFGECFRDERYYTELNDIPNVSLMSLSLDSFTLMAKSEAVASAGGTVCWEAIARGLPALSFAVSWFRPCHGVYFIDSEKALQTAINNIEQGVRPEVYLVKAFAQLIKEYGFDAAIGGQASLDHKNIDAETNAKAHFDAITYLLS